MQRVKVIYCTSPLYQLITHEDFYMDQKDILAAIGKLYLDIYGLNNLVEALKNRVLELESQLISQQSQSSKKN